MEDAEIVGKAEGRWVVLSASGRKYFLYDRQFTGRPEIGTRGKLGYVQSPVSARLTFVVAD